MNRKESVEMEMHTHGVATIRQKGGRLLVLAAMMGSFAAAGVPAAAPAEVCTPNANGVANSQGNADRASNDNCAPAWGRKAGDHTGRKVG
jgi:hypothetical protein